MILLDIFSGIGGFSLAAQWVWGNDLRIHGFIENNPFCQKVLKKHWPDVPIWNDIRAYQHDGTAIDLLCGGPPCQPASLAGKRRGEKDNRWLWPEAIRLVAEVKPTWTLFENPVGILSLQGGVVFESLCLALEDQGYAVQPFIIPACAVGAPHRRNRVWIIANMLSIGCNQRGALFAKQKSRETFACDANCDASDSDGQRLSQREGHGSIYGKALDRSTFGRDAWKEPWPSAVQRLCKLYDGISQRVDRHRRKRIEAMGNAVVPQVVCQLMMMIKNIGDL